jgi:hypothetical protein
MSKPFKTNLTDEEFREVKDLVCTALLCDDVEDKQWYLLKIGGIIVGSESKLLDSVESQGYNIKKGRNPNE